MNNLTVCPPVCHWVANKGYCIIVIFAIVVNLIVNFVLCGVDSEKNVFVFLMRRFWDAVAVAVVDSKLEFDARTPT